MDLTALAAVIGPPPQSPFPVDWPGVERLLGVRFPDDYKAFAEAYGPVLVGEWIWVVLPHDSERGGYLKQLKQRHDLQRSMRDLDPPAHPFTFHPEPGGLLLWGESRGGESYFWDTSAADDPNLWPTMLFSRDRPWPGGSRDSWQTVRSPMTDVLMARVRGALEPHPGHALAALPSHSPAYAWATGPLVLPATDDRPPPSASAGALATTVEVAGSPPRIDLSGFDGPADYGELIARLGVGRLAGVLRLLAPGAPQDFDMDAEEGMVSARLRARRAAGERVVRSPIVPEPGGLRLWGVFDGGETCWWVPVSGDADEWPVVILDADGVGWQRLPYGATVFLERWLDGGLDLPVLSLSAIPRPRVLLSPGTDRPGLTVTEMARDPLAQLRTIIGEPAAGYPCDWPYIERAVGLSLPGDYKRLIETYGIIGINGVSVAPPKDLRDMHDEYADYLNHWEGDNPLPVHPEPGGLLWCADTEGRECLWWDTSHPDPDQWTIIWDVEFDRHTFAGTLTELLVADLTGTLESSLTVLTPSDEGPLRWE
ncbi:SMI1/KNR4 family protein [Streptosporangium sp. NPDC051023]|uniref:SMI1/KNR4 family protein n=1 Tax=Streptosporangium sp. NPDC051023 TaxID=3155410 RepID=UPI00344C3083